MEDVDVQGSSSSLIADHQGNLHLSYYVPLGGLVKYGFRPAGESKWYTMAIDNNLGVLETQITVDSHDNPHICYTPRIMKYAHWDGHRWQRQEVDPGSGLIAYVCSIQVSRDEKPMISWYLESGTYLRYAILQDGLWVARSIEGGDSFPGKWSSMVLDSAGNPRIAYSHFPMGYLKYASFDGQKWSVSVVDAPEPKVDSGGPHGMGNSMILDPRGNPIISYYDEQSLWVARYSEGKWKKELVERLPSFGKWGWKSFRSTLLLDSKGTLHIGYESLRGLEHAWWDGQKWTLQTIIPTVGTTYFDNSMAIDGTDTLYITYRDPIDGSLRLAVGRSATMATAARPADTHAPN